MGFFVYIYRMVTNILKHDDVLGFVFGGNSIFTCKNLKTENRFTFKVKKHREKDIYFVSVLTNPDLYEFIGSIYKDGKFKHSLKSRISLDAQSVKVFNYIIENLNSGSLPAFIEIWHEGKCGRCGRTLTVPESISSGFGPECIKRKK